VRALLYRLVLLLLIPLVIMEPICRELARTWRSMKVCRRVRDDWRKWRRWWQDGL
jgi:inner membrane protein involved in colicin E2 resistance